MTTGHVRHQVRVGNALSLVVIIICNLFLLQGLFSSTVQAAAPAHSRLALQLPDGTLVRDPGNGKVYIIWANRRHWINSPATLSALGFERARIFPLNSAAIQSLPEGTVLGLRTVAGNLVWPFSPITSDPLQVSLSQPGVVPGQSVHLTGSGFSPNEPVAISAPSGVSLTPYADSNGNLAVDVPIASGVSYGPQLLAVQAQSSGLFALEVFHVIPAGSSPVLSLTPNPVARGATLNVVGTGFGPNEQVQVFVASGVASAVVTAGSSGAFGPISVTVPNNLNPGTVPVRAVGASTYRSTGSDLSVQLPAPAPAPAAAVPLIGVNPPVVSPGAQAVVSGSGYASGELVLVELNGVLQNSISADSTGNFGGFLLRVPAGLAPGRYSVSAIGATSGRNASVALTVQAAAPTSASISISPASVLPGTAVVIAGTGFAPGETVKILFNGSQVQSLGTDATGSFTNGSFFVSQGLAPGRYAISAIGTTSGRSAGSMLVVKASPAVIVPRFFVNPGTVTPGTSVSFGGSGFAAQELIALRINGTLIGTRAANAGGAFSGSFGASLGVGTYILTAVGQTSGRSASALLHVVRPVTPGIGLIPTRVHRGATVSVNGNNFLPGELVLVRFRGTLVVAVPADGAGRVVNARFVVPGSTPIGLSTVQLTGARSGRSASTHLQVTPAPSSGPRISISASHLHRGSTLTVSGSGFFGGEIVLIRYRGQLVQAAVANSHGAFSHAGLRIPVNSPYGAATIVITGARSGRSASAKVQISPQQTIGIKVSPGTVRRGQVLDISGHGFFAGEIVLVRVNGALIQAGQADRSGNFSHLRVVIARSIHTGRAQVQVTGGRSNRKAVAYITVR